MLYTRDGWKMRLPVLSENSAQWKRVQWDLAGRSFPSPVVSAGAGSGAEVAATAAPRDWTTGNAGRQPACAGTDGQCANTTIVAVVISCQQLKTGRLGMTPAILGHLRY